MTEDELPQIGDVLFLDSGIISLPYPTGYWVVTQCGPGGLSVKLLGESNSRLVGVGPDYQVSVKDFGSFRMTGERVDSNG